MILQSLVKCNKADLDHLDKAGDIIKTALLLVESKEYGDAKAVLLSTNPVIRSGVIDLYGNEADYCIPLLHSVLATQVRTTCNLVSCPSYVNTHKTSNMVLSCLPGGTCTFEESMNEWLFPNATPCKRKFKSEPPSGIACSKEVTIDCQGQQFPSWHCSGVRTSTAREFCNFQNIFVFSVDLHSRAGHMEIHDIPPTINLNSKKLHLHSATLWNGSHYICIFKHFNVWYLYDGLKESRIPKSGLSIFRLQPQGYLLSHVLFAS
jgi:hypothetical protein